MYKMHGPTMRGFLLKRNAEHRKANLLGSKYKQRWVELTGQTLVYAATQQDILAGKVYALREMKWVKTDGDTKFQIRFPERVLTFKVESGTAVERDAWVEVLRQAQQVGAEAGRRGGSAEKLEQLKKTAEEMLLEQRGNNGSRIAAHRPALSSAGGVATHSDAEAAGLPSVGSSSSSSSSSRRTETGQRPPSPRSLLASAKAGSLFVTSTTAGSFRHAPALAQAQSSSYHQQQDSEDDDEASCEASCGGMPADVHQGSVERAAQKCDRDGSDYSMGGGCMQPAAAAAAAAATQRNSPAASGSSTPTSKRRESLQRQLTPGVMLVNTSPAVPAAAESLQLHPAEQPSPACSSYGSPDSISPARGAQQYQHQQQQQGARRSPHSAECAASSGNDILTLDPCELAADSSSDNDSEASAAAATCLGSSITRAASGGPRPGTAPTYRPGAPLKSCLRGSGSGSSSGASLPYVGSVSTPASSADAAAAAAAALASLKPQRRQLGPQSSLSVKESSVKEGLEQQGVSSMLADGNVDSRNWVNADWDESSDDTDEQSPSHKVSHSECGVNPEHRTAAAESTARTPGVLVVKGVKADNNWLDDDFDS